VSGPGSSARASRIALVIGVAALAGFAAASWLWPGARSAPPPPAAPPEAVAPGSAGAAADASLRIESSGTLELEAAKLEPGRPVVLRLALGEPSRDDAPRPVRVIGPDGRVLEGEGQLAADRTEASFALDPAFLRPGRYVVEVKTTELTHFPLRRYAIEVR
jgi:hypothetical protein